MTRIEQNEIIYWEEATDSLTKILENKVFLIIHNNDSFQDSIDLLNRLPTEKPVVYISLSITYDSAMQFLKTYKKKVFFIDCISLMLFDRISTSDCTYIKKPSQMIELTDTIKNACLKIEPDYIIIDSISYFINFRHAAFRDHKELLDFIKTMGNVTIGYPCKFGFLYKEEYPISPKAFGPLSSSVLKMEVIK